MDYERYAIYYAPPGHSKLADFGNSWLGWDPEERINLDRPNLKNLPEESIVEITKAPSRYGFHGTLKPPFRLKEGKTFEELNGAVSELSCDLSYLVCGPLKLTKVGKFFALVPTTCNKALARLAANCVKVLDEFRAPPTDEEINKRRQNDLTEEQDELLMKWGYPYVMDEFRFHLTLTDKLADGHANSAEKALREYFASHSRTSFEINDICLFGDPGEGQPFHLIKRYSLVE